MDRQTQDAHQKALEINLDKSIYGTIAEIGAGQETARWLFRVGGAAGTIAKAISAYDMTFSDSIYGRSPRYVSRERLQAMLDHEYNLIIERLDSARGAHTTFFAFANTVAARSFTRVQEGDGWLGIRFQTRPEEVPSQIDLHVRLQGRENIQDQETVGLLGLNLIYGAMRLYRDPPALLKSLLDGLNTKLLEIDMVDFSGPAFRQVDNRLMALRLVQLGLSDAAMFGADGKVVQPADALYKKAVLIERSRFRPPTHLTLNMLDCAQAAFWKESDVQKENSIVLSEMTLHNLMEGGDIRVEDFLHRVGILCMLGKNVLISNYGEFYRLAAYLFRYTQKPIGIVMGVPILKEIFDEKYYQQLEGGILESFGRLFKNDLRFYVCPFKDPASGELTTVHDLAVAPHLQHLYSYLLENGFIKPLDTINESYLSIFSHEVLAKLRCGDPCWEDAVPSQVAAIIKQQKLFQYQATDEGSRRD